MNDRRVDARRARLLAEWREAEAMRDRLEDQHYEGRPVAEHTEVVQREQEARRSYQHTRRSRPVITVHLPEGPPPRP